VPVVTSGHGPLGFDDPDGVEPVRVRDCVSTTLRQAKPKAGTIFKARRRASCSSPLALGYGPQTGAKPRSQSRGTQVSRSFIAIMHRCRAVRSTRRKSIGAGGWTNRHVGPTDQR
jgi:hypothetical protein